jgi:glutamate racemase
MTIGVFDSGIGGLSILKALQTVLPKEKFVYLGDTQYAPYGNKRTTAIQKRATQVAGTLLQLGCNILVPACNTIVATSWAEITQLGVPVFNLVETTQQVISALNKPTMVLGTRQTASSGVYPSALGCPTLAEAIENGETLIARRQIADYCQQAESAQALVLACTHYLLAQDEFRQFLPTNVCLIDPSFSFAFGVRKKLKHHTRGSTTIYFTKKSAEADKVIHTLDIQYSRKEVICV